MVLQAIQAAVGAENVIYVPGTAFDREIDIPAAVAAAAGADVIVAVIGERTYCEVVGNINDLTLEAAQLRLVAELSRTKKPIVTVLVEGRPRLIHSIVPLSDAIVMAYLPGLEGGRAIADVLFGDVNPSGKLPFTYPAWPNGFTTYDYKWLEAGAGNWPVWEFPFGHGLSYTTFEYSNLTLSSGSLAHNGTLTASVTVRNTGKRAGKEVVLLYVSDLYREVTPPNRELKGFRKIELQPGESTTVSFTISPADLAFVGLNNTWRTEPGTMRVTVGRLTRDFRLE
jgi:beta-glucosidase